MKTAILTSAAMAVGIVMGFYAGFTERPTPVVFDPYNHSGHLDPAASQVISINATGHVKVMLPMLTPVEIRDGSFNCAADTACIELDTTHPAGWSEKR